MAEAPYLQNAAVTEGVAAPPPYNMCVTMEDEQRQHANTHDTAKLVSNEEIPQGQPPCYQPPCYQPPSEDPYSTREWPAGGGYAGPLPSNQGQPPPTIVVRREVRVVRVQPRDSFWRQYMKFRLAVFCISLVIGLIVALVFGLSQAF